MCGENYPSSSFSANSPVLCLPWGLRWESQAKRLAWNDRLEAYFTWYENTKAWKSGKERRVLLVIPSDGWDQVVRHRVLTLLDPLSQSGRVFVRCTGHKTKECKMKTHTHLIYLGPPDFAKRTFSPACCVLWPQDTHRQLVWFFFLLMALSWDVRRWASGSFDPNHQSLVSVCCWERAHHGGRTNMNKWCPLSSTKATALSW